MRLPRCVPIGFVKAVLLCVLLAGLIETASTQTVSQKASQIRIHMQQGQNALRVKDVETAEREFGAVLLLEPRNAEANVNLGVIAFTQTDYQSAVQHLRKALAAQPGLAQAQGLLGICEKRLGDKSAQASLEGAFLKLSDTKLRTQVGMELVGLYHERGDSESAIPVIQKLVDLNPEDADILFVAQRLYRDLADDTLNKLAVVAPGSARMQQAIAQRLINDDNIKGAIEHYRKALEIDPQLPGAHYELAQAVLESDPSNPTVQAEAERELAAALASEGDSARIQCELGRIALYKSNLEEAKTHYTRAFTLDPNDSKAQAGLGRVLMNMGKIEDAVKYLEMAVKADPLNAPSHYRLAQAYRRLQMADRAKQEIHLFEEITKTNDQVKALYRQMNLPSHPDADEALDHEHE